MDSVHNGGQIFEIFSRRFCGSFSFTLSGKLIFPVSVFPFVRFTFPFRFFLRELLLFSTIFVLMFFFFLERGEKRDCEVLSVFDVFLLFFDHFLLLWGTARIYRIKVRPLQKQTMMPQVSLWKTDVTILNVVSTYYDELQQIVSSDDASSQRVQFSSTTRNPDMSNFQNLWEIKFKGSRGFPNQSLIFGILSFVYTSMPFTCCIVRVWRVSGARLIHFLRNWGEQRTPGASSSLCVYATDKFWFAANGMQTVCRWCSAGSQSRPHIRALGLRTICHTRVYEVLHAWGVYFKWALQEIPYTSI